ncbi:unnamed protein product [Parascedosporium putredinis]|uniref:Nuclear speckle splicing regulatory protein 1 N-terminal domain-containing protein n=1 Tax=Parascedosporium putredinis TaxID=1442378 RepID=A0A9P1H715_9PEZI|nr:unnamed protein product [Parascedosporium putredinis]CAI8000834.1 unnamed protein product [Parascedosporium putredinis]
MSAENLAKVKQTQSLFQTWQPITPVVCLSLGLRLSKKAAKPTPARRKAFGGGDDSDDESPAPSSARGGAQNVLEFGGLDEDLSSSARPASPEVGRRSKGKNAAPTKPPTLKKKSAPDGMFEDLAGSLTARKNTEEGTKVDASLYDYDGVYEAMKPQKKKAAVTEDEERRPKYMSGLLAASAVRKRDQQVAEEKKITREREAEGEEFADKEKFVTAAYKRQQEENKHGGMTAFYRDLLNRGEKERAEIVKAAEDKAKSGAKASAEGESAEKTEAELAKEMGDKGVSVSVNEDGQIIDKRQLLQGGLNVVTKKPGPRKAGDKDPSSSSQQRDRQRDHGQSRMLEEQLAESLKRSREEEEEERQKTVEKLTKSTKTDTDISSARERYLARKRQMEEEKKKASGAQ